MTTRNADPAQVVCMKWGTKFGPEYVNRLHAMVRRNLDRPLRFVCFTDDPAGLHGDIECLPLPDVGWTEGVDVHGWRKVGLFSERLGDLKGTALFLDLDVVVTGPIDDFFEYPGEVVAIRDYRVFRIKGDYFVGNTSVLRFPVGRHPEALELFKRDFPGIRRRVSNEQEYLSHYFQERGMLTHWPKAWCPSFKAHCVRRWPLSYFRTPRLPEGARIVIFHGRPNPAEAIEGAGGKWYRGIRPTPWVSDYWHEGGVSTPD
jgi:hypothetical protein